MDHLEALTGALIDVMVEAVVAGFGDSAAQHEAMRAKGEDLRDGAAMLALFGPRLFKLAKTVLDEVERRSVPRYAACLNHVRYSSDALINELEDARRSMNAAVLAAESAPGSVQTMQVALAAVRVRAVTTALGSACVAEPTRASAKGRGPELRRREIDAADIAPAVADMVLAMTAGGGDWGGGIARLRAMETMSVNRVGIVSSLVALAEQPDGRTYLNRVATRLQRARFDRAQAMAVAADIPVAREPLASGAMQHVMSPHIPPQSEPVVAPDKRAGITERYRGAGTARLSAAERLRRSQAAHAGTRE